MKRKKRSSNSAYNIKGIKLEHGLMPFFVKEGNGGNFTKAKGWLGSQVPYA